jgi:hypothetical protein
MLNWASMRRGPRTVWARPRARTGPARRAARAPRLEPLEPRNLPDATPLLIGTWNVDIADTNGANRNPANFQPVLAAMGQEDTYAAPRPPDVLTVTEVRSNANAGSQNDTEWVTEQMNAVYGAGAYAHDTLDGASTGGGTEGVIYNTQTVRLLQSRAVGTVSSTGTVRQELRYLFRPAGFNDGSGDFYVYAGHPKAGTTSTDQNRRNIEAQQVRADADALGPGVPILYTGDFNADGSNEAAEQTFLRPGNGQAFDPINRLGNWGNNPAFVDTDTIASTGLNSRFDLLWESGSVSSSTGGPGLKDMPSTYHVFGNNGSVALNRGVNNASNTALPDLPNRLAVLNDLTLCSDHIPALQDYQVVTPSGPATHFSVTSDTNPAVAGSAFGVTVQALDAGNQVAAGYRGTVHFTSGDPYGATLPADYTFQPGDAGVHTFPGGATLFTAGPQDVTATDTAGGITGSGTVNVVAAPAAAFQVGAPAGVTAGAAFDFTVTATDPYGNTDTNYTGSVVFSTLDPAGTFNPTGYIFQPGDMGAARFPMGVTLNTAGTWDVTATDTVSGITGSATVAVSAGPLPGPGTGPGGTAPAVTPGLSGLASVLATSSGPGGTAGATSGLGSAGVDWFFTAAGNDLGGVGSARQPDAALGFSLDQGGGLAPGALLTDLAPAPLADRVRPSGLRPR